jgi:hypothetical protein
MLHGDYTSISSEVLQPSPSVHGPQRGNHSQSEPSIGAAVQDHPDLEHHDHQEQQPDGKSDWLYRE